MGRDSTSNLSVVIPTYNSSKTIARTIESALSQTIKPAEIIVVDNNSSDDTLKKIDLYKKSISILKCKKQGVSSARNFGVKFSKSALVSFLDADDIWHKNKVELQMQMLEKSNNKNILIGCYARYVAYGKIVGHSNSSINDEIAKKNFIRKGILPCLTSTWMLPKSIYLGLNGMNTDYDTAEDFEFFCRFVRKNYEFRLVREELIDYSLSEVGITTERHIDQYLLSRFFTEKYFGDCMFTTFEAFRNGSNNLDKYVREANLNKYVRIALMNKSQKRYFLFFQQLIKAFLNDPKYFLSKLGRQLL